MGQNQKGFSLVELIVVIAIMAVLGTVGVLSFATVTGRQVTSCAKELESYIGQTRIQALSRKKAELKIFTRSDGVYVNLSVEGRDIKIGRSGLQVRYTTNTGASVELSETECLVLTFDRSSGAFCALAEGGYCKELIVENGHHSKKLVLIPVTGKFYIEE